MMAPFLPSAGGNCQDAIILVEVFAVTVKPSGAFEGSTIEQKLNSLKNTLFSTHKRYFLKLFFSQTVSKVKKGNKMYMYRKWSTAQNLVDCP